MPPNTIIEYACVALDDWEPYPATRFSLELEQALKESPALGVPFKSFGNSRVEFLFRLVPVDPFLREMVLAKVNHGG